MGKLWFPRRFFAPFFEVDQLCVKVVGKSTQDFRPQGERGLQKPENNQNVACLQQKSSSTHCGTFSNTRSQIKKLHLTPQEQILLVHT